MYRLLFILVISFSLQAGVYSLQPTKVVDKTHKSKVLSNELNKRFNQNKSFSKNSGSVLNNFNPINKLDALRYNSVGILTTPWGGNRFGGSRKVRTFGDWGASNSIDGMPAVEFMGGEDGGYPNAFFPSISLDSLDVLKGGQGVNYGNGTDGGVLIYKIKSGEGYNKHFAISLDASNKREYQTQFELAHSENFWDIYFATNFAKLDYTNSSPNNLHKQTMDSFLGKFGYNLSNNLRMEILLSSANSKPEVFRRGVMGDLDDESFLASYLLNLSLNDKQSFKAGVLYTNTDTKYPARKRSRALKNKVFFGDFYNKVNLGTNVNYLLNLGLEHKITDALRDDVWHNKFTDDSFKFNNNFIVNNNLNLNLGLRYVRFKNDINYAKLNPKTMYSGGDNLKTKNLLAYDLSTSYSVLKDTRLRASLASSYNRFISKYGNFGTDALNKATGDGDRVVKSQTIEFGLNQEIYKSNFDMALYQIIQKDVPRRSKGGIESVKVKTQGLELEYNYSPMKNLNLMFGYMRILKLETTLKNGQKVKGNIFWGGQKTPVPVNQFILKSDYLVNKNLGLWGAGFYNTGFVQKGSKETIKRKSYYRIDIGTYYAFNKYSNFRFKIENLLNEKDFGMTEKGKSVKKDGRIGRVFWVGADYKF